MVKEIDALRRLYDDRQHLYDRLMRIGFIPDKDMRESIDNTREILRLRIETLRDQIGKVSAGDTQ